jgi:hypothetical protein
LLSTYPISFAQSKMSSLFLGISSTNDVMEPRFSPNSAQIRAPHRLHAAHGARMRLATNVSSESMSSPTANLDSNCNGVNSCTHSCSAACSRAHKACPCASLRWQRPRVMWPSLSLVTQETSSRIAVATSRWSESRKRREASKQKRNQGQEGKAKEANGDQQSLLPFI